MKQAITVTDGIPEFFSKHVTQPWHLVYRPIKRKLSRLMQNPAHAAGLNDLLLATLSGKTPHPLAGVDFSAQELFFIRVFFHPFTEIHDSYESLRNIRNYMSSLSYMEAGITRLGFLRYNIENYLNELYIFHGRVKALLHLINRAYKDGPDCERIRSATMGLLPFMDKAFEGYLVVRGAHVHRYRYKDDDLRRLATLELLAAGEKDALSVAAAQLLKAEHRAVRSKWQTTIIKDVRGIHMMLDATCEVLLGVLKTDKSLLLPPSLRREVGRAS